MDIEALLKEDEGDRQFAYCDSCGEPLRPSTYVWLCGCAAQNKRPGNLTIGVGHNLSSKGLNQEQRDGLLRDDVVEVVQFLHTQPWYCKLDIVRRTALQDMTFNLGDDGLMKFQRMIAALQAGHYINAAFEMLDSDAARRASRRYHRLAAMMRTGQWA